MQKITALDGVRFATTLEVKPYLFQIQSGEIACLLPKALVTQQDWF